MVGPLPAVGAIRSWAMEDNKQIALNVLKGAFIDRDPSVVGRYFAPGYTQHNPTLPDGPGPIPE
jgi:predicted SnoaL-like aldol condensation-catalyzing enzyme